jgi:hypothetical protein
MKIISPVIKNENARRLLWFSLISLAALFSLTASALIQDQVMQQSDSRDKRINLLEKLEAGKNITREEIRSTLGAYTRPENEWINPEDCGLNGLGIDEEDLKRELRELKLQMDVLRNSEEFEKAKVEFRKSMDEFRKEMDRMKAELSHAFVR